MICKVHFVSKPRVWKASMYKSHQAAQIRRILMAIPTQKWSCFSCYNFVSLLNSKLPTKQWPWKRQRTISDYRSDYNGTMGYDSPWPSSAHPHVLYRSVIFAPSSWGCRNARTPWIFDMKRIRRHLAAMGRLIIGWMNLLDEHEKSVLNIMKRMNTMICVPQNVVLHSLELSRIIRYYKIRCISLLYVYRWTWDDLAFSCHQLVI